MEKVVNYTYYAILQDDNNLIKKDKIFVQHNNARLLFPISFDKETLEKNYSIYKEMLEEGFIHSQEINKLSFNLLEIHKSLTCDNWKILIDFAKEHNINFRVNIKEEYTPEEMSNYIQSFIKKENGIETFVFKREQLENPENPFLEGIENDENIFKDSNVNTCFYINNEFRDNFKSQIHKSLERFNGQMTLNLQSGKSFDNDAKEEVIWRINYLKENYPDKKIDITFSTANRYYLKEEFIKILEIEEYIKNNYNPEYELRFTGNNKFYNKEQIVSANSKINRTVDKLKLSNLSPYEKVMFITKLLNEKKYYKCKSNDSLSRDLYSILNTRNIICTGYAYLMDVILNELNDENIKSKSETIIQTDYFNQEEYHEVNCVYIKDEKYGIEGYYNLDINFYGENYNHFMTPVTDIDSLYASRYKSVLKATETTRGNLGDQTMPIYPNNESYYTIFTKLKNSNNWQDNVLNSTKQFLSTPMGNKIADNMGITIKKDSDALKIINEIIAQSPPIPIECTQKALEVVSKSYLGLNSAQAAEYSRNKIVENIFDSLFLQERKNCKNCFAKLSKEIEEENLNKNKVCHDSRHI